MTRQYQADLFAGLAPTVPWTTAQREQAVMLLGKLLQEAMRETNLPEQQRFAMEAGNDQDYG